jgi:hypothetical protein
VERSCLGGTEENKENFRIAGMGQTDDNIVFMKCALSV